MIGLPVADTLALAAAAGISRVVTVGCDVESSRWSAACARSFAPVAAAVAIHPNETAAAAGSAGGRDAVLAEIAELAGLRSARSERPALTTTATTRRLRSSATGFERTSRSPGNRASR